MPQASNALDDSFSGPYVGNQQGVKLRKVIRRRIRTDTDGVSAAGGIDAVVSANVNEPGTTRTTVRSKTRIVQRGGRTEVFETDTDAGSGKEEKSE